MIQKWCFSLVWLKDMFCLNTPLRKCFATVWHIVSSSRVRFLFSRAEHVFGQVFQQYLNVLPQKWQDWCLNYEQACAYSCHPVICVLHHKRCNRLSWTNNSLLHQLSSCVFRYSTSSMNQRNSLRLKASWYPTTKQIIIIKKRILQ